MNAKYNDGRISVHVGDLLDSMEMKEKQDIIETLACEGDIIKHVADQIIEGYTENCFHGYIGSGETFTTPLESARYQIAIRSSVAAKYIIERLQSAAVFEHALYDQYREWAYQMRDILHDNNLQTPPCPNIQERKGYTIVLDETGKDADNG